MKIVKTIKIIILLNFRGFWILFWTGILRSAVWYRDLLSRTYLEPLKMIVGRWIWQRRLSKCWKYDFGISKTWKWCKCAIVVVMLQLVPYIIPRDQFDQSSIRRLLFYEFRFFEFPQKLLNMIKLNDLTILTILPSSIINIGRVRISCFWVFDVFVKTSKS